MQRVLAIAAVAFLLAGCSMTNREQNIAAGALIGAGVGAAVGAASTGTPQGGWAGAAIGAATGGLIGHLVTPYEVCYVQTRRGRREVPC